MDTIAISQLRIDLPTIIDEVTETLNRFIVTVSGKPKAVLMSLEEMESLEETAEILSLPGAYENIKKGAEEARKRKGIPLSKLASLT